MSVPQKKEPDASQVVSKPSLPFGWSCHVSKSVPGRCYYFNRFTNAKTWDLGELLPGHSDHASLDTAALPQSQHRFQDYHRKAVIDPSHGTVVNRGVYSSVNFDSIPPPLFADLIFFPHFLTN